MVKSECIYTSGPDANMNHWTSVCYPHTVPHTGLSPCHCEARVTSTVKYQVISLVGTPLFLSLCRFYNAENGQSLTPSTEHRQVHCCFQTTRWFVCKEIGKWALVLGKNTCIVWFVNVDSWVCPPQAFFVRLSWGCIQSVTSSLHWDLCNLTFCILQDHLDAALLCSGWWLLGYRTIFPPNVTREEKNGYVSASL